MATCPKCGKKLRLTQWRPECPYCGVNMIYYNANDRLLAETERAEKEHAKSQPRIDRAKASFFGSPKAIARLVLHVLPIGSLFLPLARLVGADAVRSVGAIEVYKYVSSEGFGPLASGALGGGALPLSVLLLLLSAVMILVCLICLVMSLGKHGKARNFILNIVMLGSACASLYMFMKAAKTPSAISPDCVSAAPGPGAYVYIALLAAILVYNLYLARAGLPLEYTPCYIGGLPSDEYFAMVEAGTNELTIRRKMVDALTAMQAEELERAAAEEAKAAAERAARK